MTQRVWRSALYSLIVRVATTTNTFQAQTRCTPPAPAEGGDAVTRDVGGECAETTRMKQSKFRTDKHQNAKSLTIEQASMMDTSSGTSKVQSGGGSPPNRNHAFKALSPDVGPMRIVRRRWVQ